jgi:UDP-glucose 4-epimerase
MINRILDKNLKPIYRNPRSGDILHGCLNIQKAKTMLGWNPAINLHTGLTERIQIIIQNSIL